MKKYFSLFLLMSFMFIISAPAVYGDASEEEQDNDAPFVYEKVTSIDMNKAEIILHSSAFIAERFTSAKSVIQLKDTDLGKLVGNVVLMNSDAGFFDAFQGINGKLIIDSKDGKYRLQVTNIYGVGKNGVTAAFSQLEGPNRYRIEPMAKSVLNSFSADLRAYLLKAKAGSNW